MRARDNPFSTDRVLRVRYRLDGTTWPELMGRLAALNYRAAIVGPHGSGKTTLLEDVAPRIAALGYRVKTLLLNESHHSFERDLLTRFYAELHPRDIILFDGAEQLGTLAWQLFKFNTRRAAGLIITTHSPGRLATLIQCRTSPKLLGQITCEILGSETTAPEIESLFTRNRGNLREALRELYDVYAAL